MTDHFSITQGQTPLHRPATLVSQEAYHSCADTNSESKEEESSIRFDDLATTIELLKGVVSAGWDTLALHAPTVQEWVGDGVVIIVDGSPAVNPGDLYSICLDVLSAMDTW